MKRIIFFLLAIMFSLAPYAQKTVHKKPVKKTARKAKAEPEAAAAEAPKKRGRKPKAEAEPKAKKTPAKRTRKPKEPKE